MSKKFIFALLIFVGACGTPESKQQKDKFSKSELIENSAKNSKCSRESAGKGAQFAMQSSKESWDSICKELKTVFDEDPLAHLFWQAHRHEKCVGQLMELGESEVNLHKSPVLGTGLDDTQEWQFVRYYANTFLNKGNIKAFKKVFEEANINDEYRTHWVNETYILEWLGECCVTDSLEKRTALLELLDTELEKVEDQLCPWLGSFLSTRIRRAALEVGNERVLLKRLKKTYGKERKELAIREVKKKWKNGGRVDEYIREMMDSTEADRETDRLLEALRYSIGIEDIADRISALKNIHASSDKLFPSYWRVWIEKEIGGERSGRNKEFCSGDCLDKFIKKELALEESRLHWIHLGSAEKETIISIADFVFEGHYLDAIRQIRKVDDANRKSLLIMLTTRNFFRSIDGDDAQSQDKYQWFVNAIYKKECFTFCELGK